MTPEQKQQVIFDLKKNAFLQDFTTHRFHENHVSVDYKYFGSAKCKELLEYCEPKNLAFSCNSFERNVISVNIY